MTCAYYAPTSSHCRTDGNCIAQPVERRRLVEDERPQSRRARQREGQRVQHALCCYCFYPAMLFLSTDHPPTRPYIHTHTRTETHKTNNTRNRENMVISRTCHHWVNESRSLDRSKMCPLRCSSFFLSLGKKAVFICFMYIHTVTLTSKTTQQKQKLLKKKQKKTFNF